MRSLLVRAMTRYQGVADSRFARICEWPCIGAQVKDGYHVVIWMVK